MRADGRIDHQLVARDHAGGDRQIALDQRARRELALQRDRGAAVAGDDAQPAGLAVEALDGVQARARREPELLAQDRHAGVRHERPAGVHRQMRGLVGDDEVGVRVHDAHAAIDRRLRLAAQIADAVAGGEHRRRLGRLAVEPHVAGRDARGPDRARRVAEALGQPIQQRAAVRGALDPGGELGGHGGVDRTGVSSSTRNGAPCPDHGCV
jgi:hypothetical protein